MATTAKTVEEILSEIASRSDPIEDEVVAEGDIRGLVAALREAIRQRDDYARDTGEGPSGAENDAIVSAIIRESTA